MNFGAGTPPHVVCPYTVRRTLDVCIHTAGVQDGTSSPRRVTSHGRKLWLHGQFPGLASRLATHKASLGCEAALKRKLHASKNRYIVHRPTRRESKFLPILCFPGMPGMGGIISLHTVCYRVLVPLFLDVFHARRSGLADAQILTFQLLHARWLHSLGCRGPHGCSFIHVSLTLYACGTVAFLCN